MSKVFLDTYLNNLQDVQTEDVGFVAVATAATLTTFLIGLRRMYKDLKDEEREHIKRKCKKYKGKEYKKCKYEIMLQMHKAYLSKIPAYKAKCSKTKNPEKCMAFLKKAEEKVKKAIIKRKRELIKLNK